MDAEERPTDEEGGPDERKGRAISVTESPDSSGHEDDSYEHRQTRDGDHSVQAATAEALYPAV